MRVSFNMICADSKDGFDRYCDAMEMVCAAAVESMRAEIEANVEAYPCCVHCGEFKILPAPGFPCGDVGRDASDPNRTLHIRTAGEIVRSGGGSTIDLACYQAAQRQRRGDDVACRVVIDQLREAAEAGASAPGGLSAYVLNSSQHVKPEKRNYLEDLRTVARAGESCGCGHHTHGEPPEL